MAPLPRQVSELSREVRFYRALASEFVLPPPSLGDLTLSVWRPRRDGPPRGLFAGKVNTVWYVMDRLGLFARDGLSVYAVHDGPRLLHRLLVTPRWHRFPFMGENDLQLGMLWTDPAMRGRGLARQAIAAVHADLPADVRALWYLVEADNTASIRLIEGLGYRLAGCGERTSPAGLSAIGQFVMTRPAAQE